MAKRVTAVTGISLSLVLYGARVAVAQNAAPTTAPAAASQPAAPEPASKPTGMLSLIQPLPDYTGDWTTRKYLTGDWGGARTQLAEKGILFDMELTQWLQGNAYGGKDTNNAFRYSGSADYYLKFDTARMGLWPGGLITLHGETQIGDNINPKVGSLMRPNYQGLFPVPGEPGITTLSEFYLTQALSEQFIILAGKIDATSLADQNAFASNQRTQFSNVGLRINPVLFNAAPYTCMAAGAIWKPTKWLQIMTAVADNDPDGGATMTGFNTAFHGRDWQTVLQEYDITLKPFGLTGHQRFGLFYTTRDFRELAADPRIQLPVQSSQEAAFRRLRSAPLWLKGLRAIDTIDAIRNPAERPDNWGLYYNFDQYLFTEAEDPEQGWGVFGRFGFAPNGGNVFEEFYSLGLGGKGAIPHRDRDSWGLGYYLANITDNVSNLLDIYAEQGVELYYNIEVTPWLHITPDLQVIVDPGGGFDSRAPAIVYGLRMQMSF